MTNSTRNYLAFAVVAGAIAVLVVVVAIAQGC